MQNCLFAVHLEKQNSGGTFFTRKTVLPQHFQFSLFFLKKGYAFFSAKTRKKMFSFQKIECSSQPCIIFVLKTENNFLKSNE